MPSSIVAFPKDGVKFSAFLDFIERCGGKQALQNKRTEEVNAEFLVPFTKEARLSYCSHLQTTDKKHLVGPAVVFISHAWKFQFLEVVDAIESHFAEQIATEGDRDSNFFIWFDMFSNNQHITNELDFQWWTGTFKSAIEQFHHTVIILAPWSNPIPFTRAWCLYEIYCSIQTGSKFEVALSRKEHSSLIETLLTDFSVIESMLGTINCEKSECFKPEDRLNIFDAVRKTEGFDTINNVVFRQMQAWILSSLEKELSDLDSFNTLEEERISQKVIGGETKPLEQEYVKYIKLHSVIGQVALLQGEYAKAKNLLMKGISLYARLSEEDREEVNLLGLEMNYNLAEVYYELKQYEQANQICEEVLSPLTLFSSSQSKVKSTTSRPPHLMSKKELSLKLLIVVLQGKLWIERKKLREALSILREGLGVAKEFLGKDHPVSIQVRGTMGYCYSKQMNYEMAESLLAHCLKSIESQNLSNHLFAIRLKYYYGSVVYERGNNYSLAKEMFESCYRAMKVRMDEQHPLTLLYLSGMYKAQVNLYCDPEDDFEKYIFTGGMSNVDSLNSLQELVPAFESTFGATSSEMEELLCAILTMRSNAELSEQLAAIYRMKINNQGTVQLTPAELETEVITLRKIERFVTLVFKTAEQQMCYRTPYLTALPLYDLVVVYLTQFMHNFDNDLEFAPMLALSRHRVRDLLLTYRKETAGITVYSREPLDKSYELLDIPKYITNPWAPSKQKTYFLMFQRSWKEKYYASRDPLKDAVDTVAIQEAKTMIDNHFTASPPPYLYETLKLLLDLKKVWYQLRQDGKDQTIIEIQEYLAEQLLSYYGVGNDQYYGLVQQLIRAYHARGEYDKMEGAIQRRLASEWEREGKYTRSLEKTYELLAYSQFHQRHYSQGCNTLTSNVVLCSTSSEEFDCPNWVRCCGTSLEICCKCHCCRDSPSAFEFLDAETSTPDDIYLALCLPGVCILTTLYLSMACIVPLYSCYSGRYGEPSGLQHPLYYQELRQKYQTSLTTEESPSARGARRSGTITPTNAGRTLIPVTEPPQSQTMNRFTEEEEMIYQESIQHALMQATLDHARALRLYGRINQAEKVLSDYINHSSSNSNRSLEGVKGAEVLEYLGDLYCQHHTRYREALSLYERSLALRRELQGDTHSDTISAMFRVGLMQQKLKQYRLSLETIAAVYRLRQRLLGETHTLTRQTLDALVLSYYLNGDYCQGFHYRGVVQKSYQENFCYFTYCVFPIERVVECCCCTPIISLPSCPSSPLLARFWDPVICKAWLMECAVLTPLFCCCPSSFEGDAYFGGCNCNRAGCSPPMRYQR